MSDSLPAVIAPDIVLQLLQINPHTGELVLPEGGPELVGAWIKALAARMLALPKTEQREFEVEHTFLQGMYLRKLFIPKGSLLIGKIHKIECINLVCLGDIAVLTESGSARLKAGYSVVSPAGIQKLGFAHEDTIFCNLFRTDETDPEQAEEAVSFCPPSAPTGLSGHPTALDVSTLKELL